MLAFVVIILCCRQCSANWGDAFGLISRVQTFCELDSMTTASKLADKYNSLDETAQKLDRMKHEYVMEHLGFGWDHALVGKTHGSLDSIIAGVAGTPTGEGGAAQTVCVAPMHRVLEN